MKIFRFKKGLGFSKQMFAAPFAVFMIMCVLFPLILLLFNAFFSGGSFSLNGFKPFFTESYQSTLLFRSIAVALAATAICLLLGYPVAYILSLTKFKRAPIILMLFIMPMWVNTLLRTYATKEFLGMFTKTFGVPELLFGLVFDFLPFMILPIYTILTNIDKSYIEAAQDLGAPPIKVFFKTVLPLSIPGIMSGFLMVFTPCVSTYFMSAFLTDNFRMFGQLIESLFTREVYNEGSALSIILLLLVGASVLITNRFTKIGNERGGLW